MIEKPSDRWLNPLRFGVFDDSDKLLGQRILPFNDLQMGYRHIALKTDANFPMALPMLFIQIDVKVFMNDFIHTIGKLAWWRILSGKVLQAPLLTINNMLSKHLS